jgi:hypothetical protein
MNFHVAKSSGPQWLCTMSTVTAIPSACAAATKSRNSSGVPYARSIAYTSLGLYPHDRSPMNSFTGISWMALMPSFAR